MYSRRDFTKIAVAATSATLAFGKPDSNIQGVKIGAQSYSFRTMPLDDAIKAMSDIGLSYVELWQGHLEPKDKDGVEDMANVPCLARADERSAQEVR